MSDSDSSNSWKQQKIFGIGTTRKPIHFVPAAVAPTQPIQSSPRTTPSISPGDRYLDIVLKNGTSIEDHSSTLTKVSAREKSAPRQQPELEGAFCEVCNLPIDDKRDAMSTASTSHESTIAHMVCLTHSHPPSHLDRSRQGLKYLSSYGWDPDSRQGLGITGEGIRAPIKAKFKNNTVGLGMRIKDNKKAPRTTAAERKDAKQVRRMDMKGRRIRERLQEMFYGSDDVEKYLGGK